MFFAAVSRRLHHRGGDRLGWAGASLWSSFLYPFDLWWPLPPTGFVGKLQNGMAGKPCRATMQQTKNGVPPKSCLNHVILLSHRLSHRLSLWYRTSDWFLMVYFCKVYCKGDGTLFSNTFCIQSTTLPKYPFLSTLIGRPIRPLICRTDAAT